MPLTDDDRFSVTPPARADPPSAPPGESLLAVEGLCKHWRGRPAPTLDDLDLELYPGDVVSVTGRNGAGKTTLLRIIGGLVAPDRGRVRLDGMALGTRRRAYQRQIGLLTPGDRGLYARVTRGASPGPLGAARAARRAGAGGGDPVGPHGLRSRGDRRSARRPAVDGTTPARAPGARLPACAATRAPRRAGDVARPRGARSWFAAQWTISRGAAACAWWSRPRAPTQGSRSGGRWSCATDGWSARERVAPSPRGGRRHLPARLWPSI